MSQISIGLAGKPSKFIVSCWRGTCSSCTCGTILWQKESSTTNNLSSACAFVIQTVRWGVHCPLYSPRPSMLLFFANIDWQDYPVMNTTIFLTSFCVLIPVAYLFQIPSTGTLLWLHRPWWISPVLSLCTRNSLSDVSCIIFNEITYGLPYCSPCGPNIVTHTLI